MTIRSQYAVEPLFFGEPPTVLFGCRHHPSRDSARNCGIVLCPPIGHEYIQSHRSFYQLAVRLAKNGFDVLRFDYFGCGDSAGDFEQGSLQQWVHDLQTAAGALRERFKLNRISLLGLRLGATLALMAAAKKDDFEALALWEPILDGKRYLSELSEIQKSFEHGFKGKKKRWGNGIPQEIRGFPLTMELRQDLEKIEAASLWVRPGMRVMTLCNDPEGASAGEVCDFLHGHPQAEQQTVTDHQVWHEQVYKRLIPVKAMNALVNWVKKAHE